MSQENEAITDDIKVLNDQRLPGNYGAEPKQYYDHLFEQYKLYVGTAESVSSRRGLSNTFFLTLHTLIIASIGTLYENGFQPQTKWAVILPLIALLTLCWTWWQLNRSYKQLNSAKFSVIDALEKHLPAQPFVSAEWLILGKGEDSRRYRKLTDVEKWVPIIFAFIYLFGAILILYYS